jgi:hypothetical protein
MTIDTLQDEILSFTVSFDKISIIDVAFAQRRRAQKGCSSLELIKNFFVKFIHESASFVLEVTSGQR